MQGSEPIETDFAWLQRTGEGVIIQRWKPGITLNVPTIRATMLARHAQFGAAPYVMIVVVPEGSDFAMSFIENDQYAGTPLADSIIAMANVVAEEHVRAIVSLYYAQHPPAYLHAVFATIEPAEVWVRERRVEYDARQ